MKKLTVAKWVAAIAMMAIAIPTGYAAAAPLTCAEFKQRLHQAIDHGGNKVAQITAYKVGLKFEDGGTRQDWGGIVGLTGSLMCGEGDEFHAFDINTEILPGEASADSGPRLLHLSVASIEALATSDPFQLGFFPASMLRESLEDFSKARERGEEMPMGSRDFAIFEGVDAQYIVSPNNVTFEIGPQAAKMDAARLPFAPKRLDVD